MPGHVAGRRVEPEWEKVEESGAVVPSSLLFLGEFEHSIDDKNRLAVPARFRAALEDGLVMTRGVDRCLVIWDTQSWHAQAERVRGLNAWQADARRMQRHFFSGAVPAQPDKLGRVVIPQFLRAYAQLETDVVVVGLADRIEVWSRPEWQRERSDAERDSAELAEHLSRPGAPSGGSKTED
jgi:MraZ protein